MRKTLKVIVWIAAAILLFAILAVLAVRFVVLPKFSQKLSQSGRGELATIVEQNNNFGAFASLSGLLANRGMLEFMTNMDRNTVQSAIDILDTLDEEMSLEGDEPSQTGTPWAVDKPKPLPMPLPSAVPTEQPSSAYDRISQAASKQEMSDGIKIINKLDMAYISSLLADGLTREEKKELKAYIYATLPKSDISRALELYRKYKELL